MKENGSRCSIKLSGGPNNHIIIVCLTVEDLQQQARSLLRNGVRARTRRVYDSAQKRFLKFCERYGLVPVPATEQTLLLYVSYLFLEGLKSSSVRVYLSGLRSMHVVEGYENPLEGKLQLQLALRALDINSEPPKQKLPITFKLLSGFAKYVSHSFSSRLLWAAITLAYFGCLRAGELTIGDRECFDCSRHLTINDVRFDVTSEGNSFMAVLLKKSKTDYLNRGVHIYVGCTGQSVCAVCAMQQYLACRRQEGSILPQSPLFQFPDGTVLTKSIFVDQTKFLLSCLGIPPRQFSGHSYRIGCATSAAASGFRDYEIKLLGRWSSEAYQRYVRTPVDTFVSFSRRLVS